MTRRIFLVATLAMLAILAVLLGGWFLTAPRRLSSSELAQGYQPNLANGKAIFTAGNCSGCHMAPGEHERTRLAGGLKLRTAFGVFSTPNISPDRRYGVGGWTELEFVNAMKRGVGRHGEHLYPAFPYASYSLLRTADVRDLFAYLKTLPAVARPTPAHDLRFPFSLRPTAGVWKLLYFRPHEFVADPARSAAWNRGAYLAQGAAHCDACHTPRDGLGGPIRARAYSGAPNLEAGGRFAVNITPDADGLGDWSVQEIADFLKSGQDKCFNEPTGMEDVIASTSQLGDDDVTAIADYIHTIPAVRGNAKHKAC